VVDYGLKRNVLRMSSMRWPKKGTGVIVHWVDATSHPGWHEHKEVKGLNISQIASIGFFISTDPKESKICQSLCLDDGEPGEVLTIPTGWVKSVHRVK
jgi:hypothetical protein